MLLASHINLLTAKFSVRFLLHTQYFVKNKRNVYVVNNTYRTEMQSNTIREYFLMKTTDGGVVFIYTVERIILFLVNGFALLKMCP